MVALSSDSCSIVVALKGLEESWNSSNSFLYGGNVLWRDKMMSVVAGKREFRKCLFGYMNAISVLGKNFTERVCHVEY